MANPKTDKTETVDIDDYAMTDAPSGESTAYLTIPLDELQNIEINIAEVMKDKEEMFLPSGDYLWRERKFSTRKGEDGRLYLSWSGQVESKDGSSEGYYQLTISPDKRYRKDASGSDSKQVDNFYKAWISALDLYFKVKEENPSRVTQVVEFLDSESYWMNITRGKQGGNYFQAFKKM